MNPVRTFLFAAVVLSGGCASVPLPPEAAAIVVTQESSRSVALYPPRLVVSGDQLLFSGSVFRQFGTRTTAKSHVDVSFLDAAGRALRVETVAFYPREIQPRTSRTSPRGRYTMPIGSLPLGTVTIAAKAHDIPHE